MKITAPARSDQINADDFVAGPATFTIAGVKEGKAEARYDIALNETPGKAWRPPLTVLRLLIAAWGDDATVWVGRRVTLYRDASVRMASDEVGGIRVSHMSDLPGGKAFATKVSISRGKRAPMRVEPLTEPTPPADDLSARKTKAVQWFATKNVTRAHLEAHIGRPFAEWTAGDLDALMGERDALVAEAQDGDQE